MKIQDVFSQLDPGHRNLIDAAVTAIEHKLSVEDLALMVSFTGVTPKEISELAKFVKENA